MVRVNIWVIIVTMFDSYSVQTIIIVIGSIFVSTAFHELMHGYIALRLGDDLAHSQGRISLNPMRHIDPLLTIALPLIFMLLQMSPILAAKPVPVNINRLRSREWGMALVAISGPLTNLALAAIMGAVLRVVDVSGVLSEIFVTFFYINIGLFVFNMIPLPPLDGSRVLYAVAPEPVQKIMEQIESMGLIAVIIFISILGPTISPVISNISQSIARLLLGS